MDEKEEIEELEREIKEFFRKEKKRASNKRYYERNKAKADASNAKRVRQRLKEMKENGEDYEEWCKKNAERAAENRKKDPLYHYKNNAKRRGFDWALGDAEADALFHQGCHYCGRLPAPVGGIDRKDNSKGYIKENVVACCKKCNRAKHTMPYEEFLKYLDELTDYVTAKRARKE